MTVDSRPAAVPAAPPKDTRSPEQIARQRAREDRLRILSKGHRKFGTLRLLKFWLCLKLMHPMARLSGSLYDVLERDEHVSLTPRDIAALWLVHRAWPVSRWLDGQVDPWRAFVSERQEEFDQMRRAAAARLRGPQ